MAYSPLPEWVRKRKIQERFEATGRQWGGKRPGAGRPRGDRPTAKDAVYVRILINRIQEMNLKELGEDNLDRGVQALIDKYV
jgi:hypothetical protein